MKIMGCVWENVSNSQGSFLQRLAVNTALLLALLLLFLPTAQAQLSGSLSGVVTDPSGSVVPNARITLTNQASQEQREVTSNKDGYFAFAAVLPGSYSVKVEVPSFKTWQQNDIIMHSGDTRSVPGIQLEVGTAAQTVEVVASATSIAPVDSGARESILSQTEINDIPLVSRNLSEVLKILPGVTTVQNGTSGGSGFVGSFLTLGLTGSTIGVGLDVNGAPYRGGTGYTLDGADILDPGCNCWSTALVDPDMTQEVQVQTSNFGADVLTGPVVVNAIGKSGTREYHGQAYLYARNDVLNANDWVDNHNGNALGAAYFYYPGASFGGPVPFTRKKVFFWFGYEHAYQNPGSANSLKSYIPAAGMLQGNFTSSGTGVSALCPNLDANGNDTSATPVSGEACSSINGMVLPNGTKVTNGMIPAAFLDPGATALEKIWPAANVSPASNGGFNYFETFPNVSNLYWFRPRVDYDLHDSNKFFVSFQYGRNSAPAGGTGAHIWYTPTNAIPFPGGGVQTLQTTKLATGHFVHVFNSSTTNEFIATWSWDNNPNTADVTPVSKTTLGYPAAYGSVFKNAAITMVPSLNSPANENGSAFTFPDFSQPDFFDAGLGGSWLAKKQSPSFADNVTKVWGSQTIKVGAYYQNVGNLQGGFNYPNGVLTFGGQNPDFFNPTGPAIGSSINPLADFVTGIASNYQEATGEPYQDMAYRIISGYFDDSYKVTRRLTIEFGFRVDHIGHWYDRQGTGMAAFFPNLVLVDEADDRPNPGVRYHGIDPGVPISGSPSRFAFVSPRFGAAYDLFGDGKTVLRGGWGKYRWNDQVNDYQGTLETSQNLLTYNLPHGSNVLLSQIGNLPAPVSGLSTPGAINGSIYATDPNDYNVDYTYAYNFTISHELPWRSLFEIAYVGSKSGDLLMGGQNGIGNINTAPGSIIDRNKMPLGALFQPDPVTGLVAADPENPSKTCLGAICNQYADYYPYRLEYGTNAVLVPEHTGWANYNAMQIMWAKSAGHLNFNLNYTWSKALGTVLASNPYSVGGNYGVLPTDRSHVINTSYVYNLPDFYHGESKFVHGATAGWMIAGTTTWQSGGNLQANYNSNLGFNMKYVCGPADPASCATDLANYGSTTIGDPTYFGTTAAMSIQPDVTCSPNSGLASSQVAKLSCFAPPAVGSNGPRDLPYIKLGAFWNSDLSISKTFHVTERQAFEIRASANNWLNHPLLSITGNDQFQLNYTKDFVTGAISSAPASTDWGFLNWKVGYGNQRIVELSAKYSF